MDKRTTDEAKVRLARIAGQVNGIQKMIESERYCVDILTQVGAIRSAVNQLGVIMLSTHLEKCLNTQDHDCSDPVVPAAEKQVEIRTSLEQFLDVH
jgi:DNA-binding FrmR family transcriptional regulator